MKVRLVLEQVNLAACACRDCNAQFIVDQPLTRIERRRFPRVPYSDFPKNS